MTDGREENVRELVLDMLLETWEKGSYAHLVLSPVLEKYRYLDPKKRRFLTRLYEGTVEYALQEDLVLNRYSKTPTGKMKPVIRSILRMGVYQLLHMDSVPDSAVCNESVKLARKRGFGGLSGFVNGVLRNIARDKENIVFSSLSEAYSMPQWILDRWSQVYDPELVERMLEGISEKRGLSIRCNRSRISPDVYFEELKARGIQVVRNPYVNDAAWISGFEAVEGIYGYVEGYFQVQDSSATFPVRIADVERGMQVLDVCAAPGGKTIQFADALEGTGRVEARDLTEYKTRLIEENVCRSGMKNVVTRCQDATVFDPDSENRFDVVLADLPCSGLGVLGKKADLRYRIQEENVEELVELQRRILSTIWRYVKPGGILLYGTCTICPQENEDNVSWFLEEHPFELVDFQELLPELPKPLGARPGMLQLLPGVHQGDGAFFAKLRRKEEVE